MKFSINKLFSKSAHEYPPIGLNAAVYFDDRSFLICADHYTVGRMNGPGRPFRLVGRDSPTLDIGRAVKFCLKESRSNLSDAERESESKIICKELGVSSTNALSVRLGYVSVHFAGESVQITPWRPSQEGGYIRLRNDPEYSCPNTSEGIGETIQAATRVPLDPFLPDEHTDE